MTYTMKAFVIQGLGKVEFVDKPIAELGPNDAIVKTTRASLRSQLPTQF
jgi:threonine dehydrogenase-like Zn-dependent dehydrogenase